MLKYNIGNNKYIRIKIKKYVKLITALCYNCEKFNLRKLRCRKNDYTNKRYEGIRGF